MPTLGNRRDAPRNPFQAMGRFEPIELQFEHSNQPQDREPAQLNQIEAAGDEFFCCEKT